MLPACDKEDKHTGQKISFCSLNIYPFIQHEVEDAMEGNTKSADWLNIYYLHYKWHKSP